MTKIVLNYRVYGVHTPIKEINLSNDSQHYYDFEVKKVKEQNLINDIPEGWFPVSPNKILLTTRSGNTGTGYSDLSIFRDWGKYFSCHSLEVVLSE